MAKVVLTSTRKNCSNLDINKAVERAIDLLNFDFNNEIKNVVIKPNLCYYWDYSTGETTDPRIVSGVIDYVRKRLGNDLKIVIAEADASAMRTKYAFKILGYEKLAADKNVELANLSDGDIREQKIKVKDAEITLPINKILLEADLIINVPKLKTHNVVGLTCALKNMFGAIAKPRKYVYHNMLSEVIVGANKIVRSDIVLVDGIIVRGSSPKKLGVLLCGNNPLATDFVAAEIMGFNPKKIKYLRIAEREGIGSTNNIQLIEDNVSLRPVKEEYPSYNYFLHKFSWKLQLKMLNMYAKVIGDIIPPILME
jgi:uncharacterized protein (DUF362 family)